MRAVYLPVVVPMIVTWASAVTAHAEWLDLDGSTAVASTLENATYLAANAFDDNTATRWSSAHSDNHWIYIDLKRDYNITALEIDWETAHSKDYTLRVRTSAQVWTATRRNGRKSPVSAGATASSAAAARLTITSISAVVRLRRSPAVTRRLLSVPMLSAGT